MLDMKSKETQKERFPNWKAPKIEHNKPTIYNWIVAYPEGLELGKYTDIGAGTYIHAKYRVVIEEDVQIGGNCLIYSENTINGTKGKIVLKKGCKIGAFTLILPNTIVEEGILIRARSTLKGGIYK